MPTPFDMARFFENAAGPVAILVLLLLVICYFGRLFFLYVAKPQAEFRIKQAEADAQHRRELESRRCSADEAESAARCRMQDTISAHSGETLHLLKTVSSCIERGEQRDERMSTSLKTCEDGITQLLKDRRRGESNRSG